MSYEFKDPFTLFKLAVNCENFEVLSALKTYITRISPSFASQLLFIACRQTSLHILKLVIDESSDFAVLDAEENTVLHYAIESSLELLEFILLKFKKLNLNVSPKNKHGVSPFTLSALRQDKERCKMLFDFGADVNSQDKLENSCLHYAVEIGRLKWIKYLVKELKVNAFLPNKQGNTPLIVATVLGKSEIVNYLLELNPKQNWRNREGQTALHAAIYFEREDIFRNLVRSKENFPLKDRVAK